MNRKERLYAIIGGCVGAILTMLVGSFFPVGAQSQAANLGHISCESLSVVDGNGIARMRFFALKQGGLILVSPDDAYPKRLLKIDESSITISKGVSELVKITAVDEGGSVLVSSADSTNSTRAAIMHIDSYGGAIALYGEGSTKSRVVLGVNEYGNGAVSTWDKNSYRLK